MPASLPVSVIITTKNEAARIDRCLTALHDFDEIILVDSNSADQTIEIAARYPNVKIVNFTWNGAYPKKRQWCLNHLTIKHDWVLFVDADEYVTSDLIKEIAALHLAENTSHAGFFVRGQYLYAGQPLRFGLRNNKLALINRHHIAFPVIDDLDIPGMGEMEGHYQPQRKAEARHLKIGQLQSAVLHDACDDRQSWQERHERYAHWESIMDKRGAWPQEEGAGRKTLKGIFKKLPARGLIAFLHCYILKLGILDGVRGFKFARQRRNYYNLITQKKKTA